jgi:hypothetical protein
LSTSDNFSITDIKWKKALKSNYVLFVLSPENASDNLKKGVYCTNIDFTAIGRKDTETLLKFIEKNKKLIIDCSNKEIQCWDVHGNDHVLSVAYALTEKDTHKTDSRLIVLTSPDGEFCECDKAKHGDKTVNSIRVIIPFDDKDITHVIYGLSKGIDASGH